MSLFFYDKEIYSGSNWNVLRVNFILVQHLANNTRDANNTRIIICNKFDIIFFFITGLELKSHNTYALCILLIELIEKLWFETEAKIPLFISQLTWVILFCHKRLSRLNIYIDKYRSELSYNIYQNEGLTKFYISQNKGF